MTDENNELKEIRLRIATALLAGHCAKDGIPQGSSIPTWVGSALLVANDLILKNEMFDRLIHANRPAQDKWYSIQQEIPNTLSNMIERALEAEDRVNDFDPGDKPYSFMSERILKEVVFPEEGSPGKYVLKSWTYSDSLPARFSLSQSEDFEMEWNRDHPNRKVIRVDASLPLEQRLYTIRDAVIAIESNVFRDGVVLKDLKNKATI
jgi:hypothetical protein